LISLRYHILSPGRGSIEYLQKIEEFAASHRQYSYRLQLPWFIQHEFFYLREIHFLLQFNNKAFVSSLVKGFNFITLKNS